ncbi:universal stress protein [Nocardia pseudobrasiliensis]|uniref:Universal stress protein family protein n=1 Tax=Nocardia pseudobrasiliensis TaxID=45979 RepID=A0A370HPQ3_9NOCA|nr:universal stress protein [Nocardia pseudobrasiliensis]RDI60478.1 universal stress protein family protein [Nocardia pseudobrasiliensis]
MNKVLTRPEPQALAVARALADIAAAQVEVCSPEASDDDYLHALADPDVALGVLAGDDDGWAVLQGCDKPVVLVPEHAHSAEAIKRVLVPLDGTDESAHAVAETVRLLRDAGSEIVVLHVFDRQTVPAHWDQAAHAREAWEEEFRARYCVPHFPGPRPTITLRSGRPGNHVVDVAAEHADMIILGWSQQLHPGRAQTVRQTVSHASVPVMLIPMPPAPVPRPTH